MTRPHADRPPSFMSPSEPWLGNSASRKAPWMSWCGVGLSQRPRNLRPAAPDGRGQPLKPPLPALPARRTMATSSCRGRGMPSKQRRRAAVALPKGVHKVTARGHEYYYFQAGRGTSAAGPRVGLPSDPTSPDFWRALREAQGVSQVATSDTVSAAIDGYLETAAKSVSEETLYNYGRSLQIARDAWGPLPIAGVRPLHVQKLMGRARRDARQGKQFPVRNETVVGMGAHARPDRQKHGRGREALQAEGRS